jgi:hypothetical protein
MRTLDRAFILAGLVSLSVLIVISSCGNNGKGERIEAKQALEAAIEKGAWRVAYFYDGQDQTEVFSEAKFQFLNNGGIIARWNNKKAINGIWTAIDARNGKLRFNLLFDKQRPFQDLDEEWVVVERTESRIILEDAGEADDRLTFEKV